MNLEHELKEALRRKTPAEGFAERVMKRATRSHHAPARARHWRAVAAALTMTAILGGWAAREAINQRAEAHAADEVLTALRITSEKLRIAQHHVQLIGTANE